MCNVLRLYVIVASEVVGLAVAAHLAPQFKALFLNLASAPNPKILGARCRLRCGRVFRCCGPLSALSGSTIACSTFSKRLPDCFSAAAAWCWPVVPGGGSRGRLRRSTHIGGIATDHGEGGALDFPRPSILDWREAPTQRRQRRAEKRVPADSEPSRLEAAGLRTAALEDGGLSTPALAAGTRIVARMPRNKGQVMVKLRKRPRARCKRAGRWSRQAMVK